MTHIESHKVCQGADGRVWRQHARMQRFQAGEARQCWGNVSEVVTKCLWAPGTASNGGPLVGKALRHTQIKQIISYCPPYGVQQAAQFQGFA